MLRLRREIVRVFARSLCSILLDHDMMWRAWFLDLSKKMLRFFYVAIFLMYIREFTCCCFARVMPEQCCKKTCIIMVKDMQYPQSVIANLLGCSFCEISSMSVCPQIEEFRQKISIDSIFQNQISNIETLSLDSCCNSSSSLELLQLTSPHCCFGARGPRGETPLG